jgi:ribosomal protein S3
MEVHRIPGNGFQEVIHQRALAIEMNRQGISPSDPDILAEEIAENLESALGSFRRVMRQLRG